MKKVLFILMAALVLHSCGKDGDESSVTYTVTFDADGGTPTPQSQTVEAGETATTPTNPTKEGFEFLFWHLNTANTAYNFQSPVNSNITLKAKWEVEATVEYWQVSWELDGGTWPASDDNHATQVVKGGTLAEPTAPNKTGKVFDGWYKEAGLTNKINFPYDVSALTADFKLYAKWIAGNPSSRGQGLYIGNSTTPINLSSTGGSDILEKALRYIYYSGANNTDYTLVISQDISITNSSRTNVLEKENVSLTITSQERHIISASVDKIFVTISGSAKLIITGKITMEGRIADGDTQPIISVSSEDAIFELGEDAILRNNTGGGVSVMRGTFIMKGGIISNNRNIMNGGGVSISAGEFIMEGGTISDNTAFSSSGNGGGVSIGLGSSGGSFIMKGGEILRNVAGYRGGGVYVGKGSFVMEGGTIYGTSVTGSLTGHPDANHVTPNETTRGHAVYRESGASATYGNGNPFTTSTNITVTGTK